jgi:membrane protease YdiL (CAAX protease family)
MDKVEATAAQQQPLWKRIVNFPLVALLIAVGVYIAALALATVTHRFSMPLGQPWRAVLRAIVDIAIVLAAYKLVIVKLGEHPRDDLPLTRDSGKSLGLGIFAGFLVMAVAVVLAAIAGVYRITGPGDASRLVLELVGTAILPGFMEELFFRGILFRWIEEFAGSWSALLLTSALFGALHLFNPNATWFAAFAIAVEAGVLLGGVYMLTGNLWMAMGLHAAWNFTQGEVFDVPVSGLDEHGLVTAQMSGPALLSGNGFGLEASVFGLIPATVFGVWIVYLAATRGKLVQPMWVRQRSRLAHGYGGAETA